MNLTMVFKLSDWNVSPVGWHYKQALGKAFDDDDCIVIRNNNNIIYVYAFGALAFLDFYFKNITKSSIEETKKEVDAILYGLSKFPSFL